MSTFFSRGSCAYLVQIGNRRLDRSKLVCSETEKFLKGRRGGHAARKGAYWIAGDWSVSQLSGVKKKIKKKRKTAVEGGKGIGQAPS